MATLEQNGLLRELPEEYRAGLVARMEEAELPIRSSLYRPREVPRYANFVTSGVVSVVTFMENGSGVEIGMLGRESLVEAFHLLGHAEVPSTGFVQVEGTVLRMPFAELRREFLSCEPLRNLVLQAVQGQSMILGQISACNRLHEVEERLARWLLMVSDKLGRNSFFLTQEFLAEMIGAGRTTVTMTAGGLQRRGLIEYSRGNIHIVHREGLEMAACECYGIVRDLTRDLYRLK